MLGIDVRYYGHLIFEICCLLITAIVVTFPINSNLPSQIDTTTKISESIKTCNDVVEIESCNSAIKGYSQTTFNESPSVSLSETNKNNNLPEIIYSKQESIEDLEMPLLDIEFTKVALAARDIEAEKLIKDNNLKGLIDP